MTLDKPCRRENGPALNPLPDKPLVSIVTPSYNTGCFIEETIRSVAQQDYPYIEHIVLDSGSTDETKSILARYPQVRLVTSAPHGLSAKINLGFSMARGHVVAWMNADDFYLPGAVSKAVDALCRHPEVAVVYCNSVQVDEESRPSDRERTRQVGWHDMLARNYVPLEAAFVRREVLQQIGQVDTRYPLVQDWDLWLRISRSFPMLYVDEWWSAYRVRKGQRSEMYKYEFWMQARAMTREHGGRLLPLFWDYWSTKLRRAWFMLLRGDFRRLLAKLRHYAVSFGWRRGNGFDY